MILENNSITLAQWYKLVGTLVNDPARGVFTDAGIYKDLSSVVPPLTFFIEKNIEIIDQPIHTDHWGKEHEAGTYMVEDYSKFLDDLVKFKYVYAFGLTRTCNSDPNDERIAIKIRGVLRTETV